MEKHTADAAKLEHKAGTGEANSGPRDVLLLIYRAALSSRACLGGRDHATVPKQASFSSIVGLAARLRRVSRPS